jgi:hypothetical protein
MDEPGFEVVKIMWTKMFPRLTRCFLLLRLPNTFVTLIRFILKNVNNCTVGLYRYICLYFINLFNDVLNSSDYMASIDAKKS